MGAQARSDVGPLDGAELVAAVRAMLRAQVHDLDAVLAGFGQVAAVDRRTRGEAFDLREHVRGPTRVGQIALEPFAGFGTPLIAAEKLRPLLREGVGATVRRRCGEAVDGGDG